MRKVPILIADDDPDDRLLIQEALEEIGTTYNLHFVEDGEELMTYLHKQAPYFTAPRPALILLDLNMPRKDGRSALAEIKSSAQLRQIPIIILTTSSNQDDIAQTYDMGVSSYITKPVSFDSLVNTLRTVTHYWLEVVQLPPQNGHA